MIVFKAYPLTLELLCISFIVPEFDFQMAFRFFILKEHTIFNHIYVLYALIFQNSRPVIENSVDPDQFLVKPADHDPHCFYSHDESRLFMQFIIAPPDIN